MGETISPTPTRRGFIRGLGGVGALAAAAETASAQEVTTHTVDMNDQLKFVPERLVIEPGDRVRWVNVGSIGHSVTAYEDGIPDGTEYWASGGFGNESAARANYPTGDIAGGETYTHTFPADVEGTYAYFCIPHEGVGMVGEIDAIVGGAAAVEGPVSILPDSAKSLAIATITSMLAVLSFAYLFIKYGGDYGEGGNGGAGGEGGNGGAGGEGGKGAV
jgi:plastocyanin